MDDHWVEINWDLGVTYWKVSSCVEILASLAQCTTASRHCVLPMDVASSYGCGIIFGLSLVWLCFDTSGDDAVLKYMFGRLDGVFALSGSPLWIKNWDSMLAKWFWLQVFYPIPSQYLEMWYIYIYVYTFVWHISMYSPAQKAQTLVRSASDSFADKSQHIFWVSP